MNRTAGPYTALLILIGFVPLSWAQQAPSRLLPARELSPDLALVPADTVLLISATLGELWNGQEAPSLKQISSVHPVVPSWALRNLLTNLGLESDNIERLVQLGTPTEQLSFIRTRRPYDREKVFAAFAPAAVEKAAGTRRYFYSQQSTNSVYPLDDRTLVLGVGRDLQAFLSRPAPANRDASLDYSLEKINNGAPFVVHAGPTWVRKFAVDQQLAGGLYATLAKAQAWQIVAEVDKGLTLKLIADFATQDEAANSVAALTLIEQKLTDLMPFMKANMIPFLQGQESQYPGSSELATRMATAIDATALALKAVDVRSMNNRAGAQIQIKTDEPLSTAVLLLTLTPRAQEE